MIRMSLTEAALAVGGNATGDVLFQGVSTDTRTLQPGALYVALKGDHFDGHDYLSAAQTQGAVAAMVRRDVETHLPVLRVDDTRLGLGRLAAAWRARHGIPVVAVTGSNGKTTTKEMIAAILGGSGEVLATRGNLNNDIGVPLTLFRLSAEQRYAVIEMGANHPGEIAYLCGLAQPTVALITNAAAAHLEGFGSLEGVARAKGEIYAGLAADGVAVINADDAYAHYWRGLAGQRRMVSFGFGSSASVRAEVSTLTLEVDERIRTRFVLHTPAGQVDIELQLCGMHNVANALAAAAVGHALGVSLAQIQHGLAQLAPVPGRLNLKRGPGRMRVIDDTYNANPASLAAALDVLAAAPGTRVLALGDMGELGLDAQALHVAAGHDAAARGVRRLYATGELCRHAVQSFGAGAQHYPDHAALCAALRHDLEGQDATVLVKGSRSSRMEYVVAALTGEAVNGH